MRLILGLITAFWAAGIAETSAHGPVFAPGIPLDAVVARQEFRGRPGSDYRTEAAVVEKEGRFHLVIVETREGNPGALIAVDNPDLDITFNNFQLTTNAPGSLLLITGARTLEGTEQRILTIAYREGSYILAGFTLKAFNQSGNEIPQLSCDYNLLNHRGVWGGQQVRLRQDPPLDLREIRETRYLNECRGWIAP